MLKAKVVQEMIGAEDYTDVAYGYASDSGRGSVYVTVTIYFLDGKLVRRDTRNHGQQNETVADHRESEDFDPRFFGNVKRFYEKHTNVKLVELFATFGGPLPLV